jgi:hypothetical protein
MTAEIYKQRESSFSGEEDRSDINEHDKSSYEPRWTETEPVDGLGELNTDGEPEGRIINWE